MPGSIFSFLENRETLFGTGKPATEAIFIRDLLLSPDAQKHKGAVFLESRLLPRDAMCIPSTILKEFRNSIFTECYKNPQEGKKKRTRDRHLSSATSSFFSEIL